MISILRLRLTKHTENEVERKGHGEGHRKKARDHLYRQRQDGLNTEMKTMTDGT